MDKPSSWPQEVTKKLDGWNRSSDSRPEYDKRFGELVCTERVESWEDFCQWSTSLRAWGFRGQRDAGWGLQSSLEREAASGGIRFSYHKGTLNGNRSCDRKEASESLLAHFRKLDASHLRDLPPGHDLASWLSLMQHYGGPTRLLDWTECPFVAMYFALREDSDESNCSALWAIDLQWLERKEKDSFGSGLSAIRGLRATINYTNRLLDESGKTLVVRIDPRHKNQRMSAQKGFFLWKLYEQTPLFDQMLMDMMLYPEIDEAPVVRKLEIDPKFRLPFLERLRQDKNINEDSLFPGYDFCEPLRLELRAMVDRARIEAEEELQFLQMAEVHV